MIDGATEFQLVDKTDARNIFILSSDWSNGAFSVIFFLHLKAIILKENCFLHRFTTYLLGSFKPIGKQYKDQMKFLGFTKNWLDF